MNAKFLHCLLDLSGKNNDNTNDNGINNDNKNKNDNKVVKSSMLKNQ